MFTSIASLAVLLGAGVARADTRNLALEWVAPPDCPGKDEVEARIRQLIGEELAPKEPLRAEVVVVRDPPYGGSLHADVRLSTEARAESARRVDGESCAALAEAVALIVALAVEPALPDPTPSAPTGAGSPPEADRSAVEPPRRLVFASASARADVASLPRPGLGGEVAIGLRPPNASLDLVGAALASARGTLDGTPAQGADVRLFELGARGCWQILDERFDFGPCAGMHVRWLFADGFGSEIPRSTNTIFGAFTLGGLAKAQISSRLALRLSVEAALPTSRPSFGIENAGFVYRVGAVALRTAVGAELHF